MGRRRNGSCCWSLSFGGCFVSFSVFLAVSVAIARGDRQRDDDSRRGTGDGRYTSRAPRICPHRPDHCTSVNQTPWICRPESGCSRNNLTIQPDSKFVKSDASVDLTASTYYFNASDAKAARCNHALNLTWAMNPKGVIGFFLRITRYGPSLGIFNRTLGLTFWIDERRLAPETERENGMVTFYSDCVRLGVASTYSFDLFSVQAVPESSETVTKFIGMGSLATDCDTYPEDDPVFGMWDAYTNVTFSASDSSVKVFFTPAPQSFGFHDYALTVSRTGSSETLAAVYNLAFTCTNFDAVIVSNICPGTYAVLVTANGGQCPCTNCSNYCVRRSEFVVPGSKDDCRNDNIRAFVQSPVVDGRPMSSAVRMPVERTTSDAVKVPNSSSVVDGIVIVAFGVVVSMAILAVAAHAIHRRKLIKSIRPVEGATTVAPDFEENAVVEMGLDQKKRPVLVMIHASDNAYHCNAVRRLAAYLERRCRCRVRLAADEWRSGDELGGGQLSAALDRLLVQMESADAIVVVNSEAGWRQYEGDSRNVTYRKVTTACDASDVVFLAAVKNLRRTRYLVHTQPKRSGGAQHSPHRKLFRVAFPYTDPKFFIDDHRPGRTYRLMDHIEELLRDVRGLPETSGDGSASVAVGIGGGSEHARCAEGRQLQVAVDQAVEYFRSSADWFWSFYRQETTTTETTEAASEQTTSTPTCCDDDGGGDDDAPWLSASPEECGRLHSVLDSGFDSSAEHMYLETNFVPPSGGGYDDDGDDDDDDDDDSILRANLSEAIVQLNDEYDKTID